MILRPMAAYNHNIPSLSLVTTVKPNLTHAGTMKRIMVGRDAAVTSRHAAMSEIEENPHISRPCFMPHLCS